MRKSAAKLASQSSAIIEDSCARVAAGARSRGRSRVPGTCPPTHDAPPAAPRRVAPPTPPPRATCSMMALNDTFFPTPRDGQEPHALRASAGGRGRRARARGGGRAGGGGAGGRRRRRRGRAAHAERVQVALGRPAARGAVVVGVAQRRPRALLGQVEPVHLSVVAASARRVGGGSAAGPREPGRGARRPRATGSTAPRRRRSSSSSAPPPARTHCCAPAAAAAALA